MDPLNNEFILHINSNAGIARKVSRIYTRDKNDQDDLLQEMMFQLWKSFPSFDGRAKFSTWMYRVCLNTALTFKRKHEKEKTERFAEHHEFFSDADDRGNEMISLLYKAIEILSPVNKAIVLLYLEDLSYDEIASITGLSKSNVSVRLVRIRKELENELKKSN
jgi:RNA polymerase sigma factor (sigma-70 family)